jgi:hypothetical protein
MCISSETHSYSFDQRSVGTLRPCFLLSEARSRSRCWDHVIAHHCNGFEKTINAIQRFSGEGYNNLDVSFRARGVRSIIRVRVGVSIRLGLCITCTPSLYLSPCTSIYTPTRVQAIQHKILGILYFQYGAALHVTPRVSMWTSLNPHVRSLSPASTSPGGRAHGAWSGGPHTGAVYYFLEYIFLGVQAEGKDGRDRLRWRSMSWCQLGSSMRLYTRREMDERM